ncbi:MAG TPA: acVLRF1 family peptidyl-tRNA hydrolase [Lapillicoccus sp.]|nr:acVLRF1 family peptidyl-tRNA hydrolase [Lapillicoccus sp.]
MTSRDLEVAPERLDRWVAGFVERHGPGPASSDAVTGADGASAAFERFDHDPLGVLLVRRGGYAVGLARDGHFVTSKVGTRYVQSRTAAGGWSQQRFARRRGNQADALVEAVATHTAALVVPGRPAGLVVGGDRALVRRLLEDPRLRELVALPRRELYDVPDPRRDVLDRALDRGRAVHVRLTELPL